MRHFDHLTQSLSDIQLPKANEYIIEYNLVILPRLFVRIVDGKF